MNPRRRIVSPDDPQTTRLRRSSRLIAADELLLNIPIDLVIDIFSRLPLNSIARCRCVSKRWASILRGPDFTELFLTKSLARPKLLFACEEMSKVTFFSSPQTQNPGDNLSGITADHRIAFRAERVYDISTPVNGFVCIRYDRTLKGRKTRELVSVICNPSTGQSFTLPKVKKTRKWTEMRSFLGYDPVEKQHKVLAMTKLHYGEGVGEDRVLTLRGNGSLTWRRIECGTPHRFPRGDCLCIGGVLYYASWSLDCGYFIVCFDVRSEKYSFVKATKSVVPPAVLLDYNGKLGSVMAHPDPYFIGETSTSFEVWILEDPEKHEWSNRVFELPPMWKDVVAGEDLCFEGVTTTNEIVLTSNSSTEVFHVYYYNFDKDTIRRVEIQGMRASERGSSRVLTFLNHVEDVRGLGNCFRTL